MSVLKKPFDQKEYENMMSLFQHRTPVMNFKHLRDESIAYPTNRLGSSYLDHFPGKRLNLTHMLKFAYCCCIFIQESSNP